MRLGKRKHDCLEIRMLRFGSRATLCAGLTIVAAACFKTIVDPVPPSEQRPARTSLPRALTPSEREVLGATNAFSFNLWKTINAAQRDSNVFVSPLSASFALGMTMN